MRKLDFLHFNPEITINNEEGFRTKTGAFLTIFISLFTIITVIFLGKEVVMRDSPTSLVSYLENPNPIVKNSDIFFAISAINKLGLEIEDLNQYLSFKIGEVDLDPDREIVTYYKFYDAIACYNNSDYFINNKDSLLEYLPHKKEIFLCPPSEMKKDIKGIYGKKAFTAWDIRLFPCVNASNASNSEIKNNVGYCKSEQEISNMLDVFFAVVMIKDTLVDLRNLSNPINFTYKTYINRLSQYTSRQDIIVISLLEFVSDEGYLLEDKKTTSAYYIYSKESDYILGEEASYLYRIILTNNLLKEKYVRQYVKIQKIAADIGGIVKFIMIFFYYINQTVSKVSFLRYLGHNLIYRINKQNNDWKKLINLRINENRNSNFSNNRNIDHRVGPINYSRSNNNTYTSNIDNSINNHDKNLGFTKKYNNNNNNNKNFNFADKPENNTLKDDLINDINSNNKTYKDKSSRNNLLLINNNSNRVVSASINEINENNNSKEIKCPVIDNKSLTIKNKKLMTFGGRGDNELYLNNNSIPSNSNNDLEVAKSSSNIKIKSKFINNTEHIKDDKCDFLEKNINNKDENHITYIVKENNSLDNINFNNRSNYFNDSNLILKSVKSSFSSRYFYNEDNAKTKDHANINKSSNISPIIQNPNKLIFLNINNKLDLINSGNHSENNSRKVSSFNYNNNYDINNNSVLRNSVNNRASYIEPNNNNYNYSQCSRFDSNNNIQIKCILDNFNPNMINSINGFNNNINVNNDNLFNSHINNSIISNKLKSVIPAINEENVVKCKKNI